MKINNISLENFRGFNELDLPLNGQTTIIVGGNGAGKSSILTATTYMLSRIVEKISYGMSKRMTLNEEDIKIGKHRYIIGCELELDGEIGGIKLIKPRSKSASLNSRPLLTDSTKSLVNYFKDAIEEDKKINLPIFVHYPVNRIVIDVPLRIKNRHEFDQLSAYLNCFKGGTDFRTFFEWFRNQEDLENEIKLQKNLNYIDKHLESVREAIYSFMPGFSDLKIVRKGKMRMVINKYGQRLEINQLSDGEKCTLALIGDLARRLAIANPYLDNSLEGSGVVLIDEIELHLHPEWQRIIINRLQTVFPKLQFIISTHSPQVLGEVKDANVYSVKQDLKNNTFKVEIFNNLFGKDSNLILEEHMEATSKNKEVKEQINKLFELIAEMEIENAEVLLKNLSKLLGENDPNLLKAEVIIKRKKHLKK